MPATLCRQLGLTSEGHVVGMIGARREGACLMVFGAHVIVHSKDATADRAFFREVLGFPSVDAGDGWLIFTLPPAEVAVRPAEARPTRALPHVWRPEGRDSGA